MRHVLVNCIFSISSSFISIGCVGIFMIPWMQITSVADTVVTVPAAATIGLWLIAGRAPRMALWWCALFSIGLGLVAATKIAYVGWGIGISEFEFTGMSGHAMRATAVFPVVCYLVLQKSSASIRASGVLLGVLFGILVGISRVALNVHSVSDVVAGCFIGGAVSLGFIWISRGLPRLHLNRWIIALGLSALLPTSYASPAPTSRWVNAVALYLSGNDVPYERKVGRPIAPDEGQAR
jgi:membrane-associated phospholipid phosphatase